MDAEWTGRNTGGAEKSFAVTASPVVTIQIASLVHDTLEGFLQDDGMHTQLLCSQPSRALSMYP